MTIQFTISLIFDFEKINIPRKTSQSLNKSNCSVHRRDYTPLKGAGKALKKYEIL